MLTRSTLLLTFAAALGSGLVAGVFFAFSSFIMPAFARIRPDQSIAAMQAINVAVINPGFLLALFGTAVIGAILVAAALFNLGPPRYTLILIASAFYIVGCSGVTMMCNVPLNHAIAAVLPGGPDALPVWTRFLKEWTLWNHVRTLASAVACALYVAALAGR